VLEDVLREMDRELRGRRASVRIDRPLAGVLAQPVLLGEVLRRLLSNAARFVRDGKEPQISIRTESREEWVRLWIEDNGIGIAPEYQDRIFGPGERLESDGDGNG